MDPRDTQKRLSEAYKLLAQKTTTREKFVAIRVLVKGFSPRLDSLLDSTSRVFSDVEKLQKGDIILLSAEHMPENTEEEKKRKRKVLLLINSWRDLESEVKRLDQEFNNIKNENTSNSDKINSMGKILSSVKGPFGIITLGALVIVGGLLFFSNNNKNESLRQNNTQVLPAQTVPITTSKTQVIIFKEKKLPLKDLYIGQGPECMSGRIQAEHYHALHDGWVEALDGTLIEDPGGCGFGKVAETEVIEVDN